MRNSGCGTVAPFRHVSAASGTSSGIPAFATSGIPHYREAETRRASPWQKSSARETTIAHPEAHPVAILNASHSYYSNPAP